MVVAGVVLPAWLDDAMLDAELPNRLEPPALPAIPKSPLFGAWSELVESKDLLGVERPENSVLFDASLTSEPGGFPKLKLEL